MSMDQMAVLLVSNVNESKGHSEYICLSHTKEYCSFFVTANLLALCSQYNIYMSTLTQQNKFSSFKYYLGNLQTIKN